MNSPEERWWSVRAGEYVLGTLRGRDLELFERILSHDTEMQREVARWTARLAPLDAIVAERAPGEHVWERILERVRDARSRTTEPVADADPAIDAEADAVDSAKARARVRERRAEIERRGPGGSPLWPAVAALASAASLVLGLLLYRAETAPEGPQLAIDGLAVVLSDEDGTPYFLVETDQGRLRVRVTALAPPLLEDDRDFQLWQALPDGSGVSPVALLPEEPGASRTFDVDSLVEGSELFGVSIEPIGAPTDAGPTGPVVAHGDVVERRAVD